jgi:hypothetical protein
MNRVAMHPGETFILRFAICGDFCQHTLQSAPTEATPFGDLKPRSWLTRSGFLKQKSRGNHHAIGFYFVKSAL